MNIVLFRPRAVRYSRFLLWSCDTFSLFGNKTTNAVLRWIVWSLNSMYDGKHPTCRPGNRPLSQRERDLAGQPLTAGHHIFQVVELRGDWEFHKSLWNFRCSWKGGVNVGICFKCPAMAKCQDHGLLYWYWDEEGNDETQTAWTQKEFDTMDYITERLPSRHICYLLGHCVLHMFYDVPKGWMSQKIN